MKNILAIAGFSLLIAACTPAEQAVINDTFTEPETQDMMIEDNNPSNDDSDMIDTRGEANATYMAYTPEVLMNGETKVLFFHAAWCPVCRSADTQLQSWFNAGTPDVNVYKVDYDTETELKSRFGVTYQHTYVTVDGDGNAVQTIQGPTELQLQQMIGAL